MVPGVSRVSASRDRGKVVVAGLGYVGLPLACALAAHRPVVGIDVNEHRVRSVNRGISPLAIAGMDEFLEGHDLDLVATVDEAEAYVDADVVIIAVSTDYDALTNRIDTSAVEAVLDRVLQLNPDALVVIRSTVPVGFTDSMVEKTGHRRILCSPEFLRESSALQDTLHPARIIVGTDKGDSMLAETAQRFIALMLESIEDDAVPSAVMGRREAEAAKLFSNAYLAMRVAFFNELDTYAAHASLDAREVIEAMGHDSRIGDSYNNPGFGFGGYCLPKDTRQLLFGFGDVPQKIISAISESNDTRMDFIVDDILSRVGETGAAIGIFRLVMEAGATGLRHSSLLGIIQRLQERDASVLLYEPLLGSAESFLGCPVENDLEAFKERAGLIVANRYNHCLDDVFEKTYTRDAFGID